MQAPTATTSSASQAASGARENEKPCPWVRTAERRPTKSDADCEGQIWTWQEYFSENEETAQMESIGFRVRRHGWMGVARYDRFAAPFWMPTGLTRPIPPVPEGQQAPVATAVQTKTESSGLSVGERCAEKMRDVVGTVVRRSLQAKGLSEDENVTIAWKEFERDAPAIINQTIEEYGKRIPDQKAE